MKLIRNQKRMTENKVLNFFFILFFYSSEAKSDNSSGAKSDIKPKY